LSAAPAGGGDRLSRIAASDPGPPVLEIQHVAKRYGGIYAVNGVSIDLYPREILGMIGQNGAGKTTLVDVVSGLLSADEGRVLFGGDDITSWPAWRRSFAGLGRSFQDAHIFPSLTVAENIAIALDRHIKVRDHLAAALNLPAVLASEDDVVWTVGDVVELMGLGGYRRRRVAELSTGTRRLVDLAMVVAHDPVVVLLDEPSSGIAHSETEALAPVLLGLRQETGCAMVVIEHDLGLLTAIADELVALEAGSVVTRGHPEEVLRDPRVVASYLGAGTLP
jgi:branched-chain amino acid transport system ATP-binding protein